MTNDIRRIAAEAGEAIMKTYDGPAEVETKEGIRRLLRPTAGTRLHRRRAGKLTRTYLCCPRETEGIPIEERLSWNRFWLVDPLDGTQKVHQKNRTVHREHRAD
ncbi:MAG: hypothetical protein Ct9H300mP32_5410 [Verrucomicrobiota bacterium]|nr:MAG: hypothetical protein Ct9H300mP32_5410 [Verrucomicrobiota bacterium]